MKGGEFREAERELERGPSDLARNGDANLESDWGANTNPSASGSSGGAGGAVLTLGAPGPMSNTTTSPSSFGNRGSDDAPAGLSSNLAAAAIVFGAVERPVG